MGKDMYCFKCMKETKEGMYCAHCGSPLRPGADVHHLAPETILDAKYLVGDFIGEGGFGITYIGRDLNLDIRVAIKEYYPRGHANRNNKASNTIFVTTPKSRQFFEKGKKSFLQEARSLAKFSDEPGIVNVKDYFEENGTAYIVMEYLEGETLRKRAKREGRLQASALIGQMLPVMRSLEKCHEAGMIHRDISPDNIMCLKNGTLKLMDFGAARDFSDQDQEMSVILKKGFSPEEQFRHKGKQGPWTDVYSLCATIYNCITGILPENAIDRLHNDTVQRPSALGVQISAAHENAIMKGMGVLPEDRCRDIGELRYMLGMAPDMGGGLQNNNTNKAHMADAGYFTDPQPDSGPQSVPGPQSVSGSMSVSGAMPVSGPMSVPGPQSVSGAMPVSGPMSVPGPQSVSGLMSVPGSMSVPGPQSVSGAMSVPGPQPAPGPMSVSRAMSDPGRASMPASGHMPDSGYGHRSGPEDSSKRIMVILSAFISICIVITAIVAAVMLSSGPRGDKVVETDTAGTAVEAKKTDTGSESEEEDAAASDGEITVTEMKTVNANNLKKKYKKMSGANILRSEASSVIKQEEGVSNLPEYLFDGDIQTNWQEGVSGAGIGEYVSYEFKEIFKVRAMTFQLGNWKTEEYYYGNNRPKTLTLSMGDDHSWTLAFPDEWTEFGIKFSAPVRTDTLKITIDDVYRGKSWNDTVITDIGVWCDKN